MGHVEQVAFGVLELRRPEQRVEWADLDADAAVHAQRVVDGEAVEHVASAFAAAFGAGRDGLLVRVDVDAPVRALARTQHARRAVLLEQRDDAARPGWQLGPDVRVFARDRAFGHRSQRDAETLQQALAGDLFLALARFVRHPAVTTRTTPVSATCASASGTSATQASRCSWSSRSRG